MRLPSAARCVQYRGFSSRQTFGQHAHGRRIENGFGMTMRVDKNVRRPLLKPKCLRFLRQSIGYDFSNRKQRPAMFSAFQF